MENRISALRRLAKFTELTESEILHLAQMTRPVRRLDAKTMIAEEGANAPQCFLLLDGWVGSFSTSRHGRRTMTAIYLPGDLLGSISIAFREFAETLVSLCPVAIAAIPIRALGSLFETHPRVASLLYLISQEERVHQMDWVSSLLRLDAAGRIANLFLNLHDRYTAVSAEADKPIPFYLSQYDIADLTGLTATHTNRVIQQFRRDGAIDLRHHILTIVQRRKLEQIADRPHRLIANEMSWLPEATR